jgi:DNA-binding transcriptional ArsR family regulator
MNHSLSSLTLNNGKSQVKINFLQTKKAAMILRALNHGLRQKMLKLLDDKKKITVTEVYVKLHLEQSVASQHLAILRRAEIVSTVRDGKYIYYSPNYERVAEIMKLTSDLVE